MKHLLLFLFIPVCSFAQNNGDKKILLTLQDSISIYDRVRIALVKNNFMVKDDGDKKTISTYPREMNKIPGYSIARAEISGSTVTLYGFYGSKKINDWGYTANPKNYKPTTYYKGSKVWKLLMEVANTIGGQISYAK